jgi:hypothetical protein
MLRKRLLFVVLLALILATASVAAARPQNWRAHLSGAEENPPVETDATGQAIFQLRGDSMSFKLIVANIDNVVAAHIHCGVVGVNGPVGVTLFSGPPDSVNGILSQGAFDAPDDGNACGWADLAALTAAMDSGDAYVNVHTNPGTPSGEIRGQIR